MLKSIKGMEAGPRAWTREDVRRALAVVARLAALSMLLFALSRAQGFGGLAPFAVACFAAGLALRRSTGAMLLGCVLGAVKGGIETFNLTLPAGCAIALGGSLAWSAAAPTIGRWRAARRRAPRNQARSPNRASDATQAAALAGTGVLIPGLLLARGEPWASAPFMVCALAVRPGRRFLVPEERTGLAAFGAATVAGLYRLWPPLAMGLGAGVVSLCAPAGAASGAVLGGALLLASGDARAMALLTVGGVAVQLCVNLPAPARGGIGGVAAMAAGLFTGCDPVQLAIVGVAMPAAALVPERWAAALAGWTRKPEGGVSADRLIHLLRGRSADRLRAMGEAFGELAEGYLEPDPLPDEQALMAGLRGALCDGCPGYGDCWSGGDNRAARLLCDLVAMAAAWAERGGEEPLLGEGVPPDIGRRCRRARLIPERLSGTLMDFAVRRRAALERGGRNRLTAAQFMEARRLLEALAEAEERPVHIWNGAGSGDGAGGNRARRAASALERAGFELADVAMVRDARTELLVALREGRWSRAMAAEAARRVGCALGRPCEPEGAWERTLHLAQRPRLAAKYGAASRAREVGLPCGDSWIARPLPDDRLLLLLCDGMGSGEAAARESAGAARLLGKLLAAGARWPLAVETANAALINASEEEMFSTADALVLDLSSGMAELAKLAACPTLIVRDGCVERVGSGSMPLGIVERPRPCVARVQLLPGDLVLMASDGVLDVADEDALEEALCRAAADADFDMDALAGSVLDLAEEGGRGPTRDDMTAICLRVSERET